VSWRYGRGLADADGLKSGPRDHLITRALERLLQQLDAEFREDLSLDRAEGPDRLARCAMAEIARQRAGDESAGSQAARLNDVVRQIAPDEDGWAQAEVVVPARILSGIRPRSLLDQPLDLPPLPATPFSQSGVLVNGEGQPKRPEPKVVRGGRSATLTEQQAGGGTWQCRCSRW
jgi:hypothetical protein